MAILSKLVSGMMHEDNFDSYSLLWELSPNDYNRIVVGGGNVELRHGDERISMSISTPSDSYVFQAEINHEPKSLTDIGGVLVSAITDNSIECQTYFNSALGSDQYIKYIKVCVDKAVYVFHSSSDGISWHILGNAEIPDANRIGFFLDGKDTVVSEEFMVHSVSIYKSNVVTLNNIPENSFIKVLDNNGFTVAPSNGNIITRYGNKAYLDLTNIIFPMKDARIQIFNELDIKIMDIATDICGGDIYECSENIEITIDDIVIDRNVACNLGQLTSSGAIHSMTIKNVDTMKLAGKTLRVAAYSNYNRGDACASIAIVPVSGVYTDLVYEKQVTLPVIPPGELIEIRMKVNKDINNLGPFLADKYKFKIVLE